MRRLIQALCVVLASPMLLQLGCFNPADFQAIAQGQFIAFINALINSVTSDALQGLLST